MASAPEQTWLPQCTYTSHCTSTVVYIWTPTLLHTSIKNQHTATFIYHITAKYVPATNVPIKCNVANLFKMHQWEECYVWQCSMVLRFGYGYSVTYILTCIGALQYTKLIFGFTGLHSLRQYIRRKCDNYVQIIHL